MRRLQRVATTSMRKRADPEFKAIKRAAAIETGIEVALLGILLVGLGEASSSFAGKLLAGRATTAGLFTVFGGALAYVLWSFSKRRSAWSDHLKDVVPLSDFLGQDPANRVLAPDLNEDSRAAMLRSLQAIVAREDVMTVKVGLLPEEGYRSDRVLVKTFAPHDVICQWQELLQTEFRIVSTLRYEVDGKRRKVRSLLFLWD